MKILEAVLLLCVAGNLYVQGISHKKVRKLKSERKRNIEYGNTNSGGYSAPALLEQAASNVYSARQSQSGPPPQIPPVLDALDILRGRPPLTAKEANDVIAHSTGGKDYPAYLELPKTYFSCSSAKPGLYADLDHYCQAYHRCDISGKQSTFLCPPKTLFNQITLVCDWFYNINCVNSRQFVEYSNSRLYYPQWQILDTQLDYVQPYAQAPPVQQQPYAQVVPQVRAAEVPQPPPVLYPGKPSNQIYNAHINGHENPEYQMSVVIRNPQLVPDYSAGASDLVPSKEQMDQGSTASPPPVNNPGNNNPAEHSGTSVVDSPQRPQVGGSVNVTINLSEPSNQQQNQGNQGKNAPIQNQRFTM